MFVAAILLTNVGLPTALAASTIWGSARIRRRPDASGVADASEKEAPAEKTEPADTDSTTGGVLDATLAAVCCALAMWLVFGLRHGWSLEDAWLKIPVGTALVALGSLWPAGRGTALTMQLFGWTARLGLLLAAAMMVFPTGEGWEFLLPARPTWLATMIVSASAAWWLLARLTSRQAGWLGLGWIALTAASAFLTAQSFLKVTEPLLAVASLLGCFSLAALFRGRGQLLMAAAGPCLFAYASIVATAQFNSFLGLSDWLSWLSMSAPALSAGVVALVSQVVRGRNRGEWIVWLASLIGCLALAAAVVLWTLLATGGGGESEW